MCGTVLCDGLILRCSLTRKDPRSGVVLINCVVCIRRALMGCRRAIVKGEVHYVVECERSTEKRESWGHRGDVRIFVAEPLWT